VPVIEEVERWAVKNDEACQISYGEYIDDPNVVEEDRLRSNGGCVVLKDWTGKMPEGIVYRELPRRLYVIAIFYGAPSIGPQKVYPKVREYMEQQGLVLDAPVIEMYERLPEQKLRTIYHFPARKK
jgi:effector-binding domain-containing protein